MLLSLRATTQGSPAEELPGRGPWDRKEEPQSYSPRWLFLQPPARSSHFLFFYTLNLVSGHYGEELLTFY